MRKVLLGVVAFALALVAWQRIRHSLRPRPGPPSLAALAQAQRVRILRDKWGVPHVFGQSDADAAFGLAYAHAEDDWPTIQGALAAARGQLGLLLLSKTAIGNDYYAQLVRVREQVDEQYGALPSDYRAVLEGYASGLALYCSLHPDEADGRLFPISGRDVAAGFVHKIPLMIGMAKVLQAIDGGPERRAGDALALESIPPGPYEIIASNEHAVLARRSTDGITRLNVNSTQPWEGPVSWYEAQIHSEAGWNMTGGTFPGAPVILHGHNDHLGWAHTNNAPHQIDVYRLETDDRRPGQYSFE